MHKYKSFKNENHEKKWNKRIISKRFWEKKHLSPEAFKRNG